MVAFDGAGARFDPIRRLAADHVAFDRLVHGLWTERRVLHGTGPFDDFVPGRSASIAFHVTRRRLGAIPSVRSALARPANQPAEQLPSA
jgi:hypothetical protein